MAQATVTDVDVDIVGFVIGMAAVAGAAQQQVHTAVNILHLLAKCSCASSAQHYFVFASPLFWVFKKSTQV